MRFRKSFFIFFIFSITHLNSFGANIYTGQAKSITGAPEAFTSIIIDGDIIKGDLIKLSNILTQKLQSRVVLNSNGGDLGEAIRMGEMISAMRLDTRIDYQGQCLSACFFLWLNGKNRSPFYEMEGKIGLHRPYLNSPENTEKSLKNQNKIITLVKKYLEEKNIPRYLIDIMMVNASNSI